MATPPTTANYDGVSATAGIDEPSFSASVEEVNNHLAADVVDTLPSNDLSLASIHENDLVSNTETNDDDDLNLQDTTTTTGNVDHMPTSQNIDVIDNGRSNTSSPDKSSNNRSSSVSSISTQDDYVDTPKSEPNTMVAVEENKQQPKVNALDDVALALWRALSLVDSMREKHTSSSSLDQSTKTGRDVPIHSDYIDSLSPSHFLDVPVSLPITTGSPNMVETSLQSSDQYSSLVPKGGLETSRSQQLELHESTKERNFQHQYQQHNQPITLLHSTTILENMDVRSNSMDSSVLEQLVTPISATGETGETNVVSRSDEQLKPSTRNPSLSTTNVVNQPLGLSEITPSASNDSLVSHTEYLGAPSLPKTNHVLLKTNGKLLETQRELSHAVKELEQCKFERMQLMELNFNLDRQLQQAQAQISALEATLKQRPGSYGIGSGINIPGMNPALQRHISKDTAEFLTTQGMSIPPNVRSKLMEIVEKLAGTAEQNRQLQEALVEMKMLYTTVLTQRDTAEARVRDLTSELASVVDSCKHQDINVNGSDEAEDLSRTKVKILEEQNRRLMQEIKDTRALARREQKLLASAFYSKFLKG